MLVDKTQYLTAGIHIGMKTCTPSMKQFVYKVREDGLAVFNLQQVDKRIDIAASFLSRFDTIFAVSRKESGHKAVRAFAEALGGKGVPGRFTPGTLTNPHYRRFFEPDVVVVADPLIDSQVIKEAKKKRIPIVALCDTFNSANDVDYIIPVNNNGKKSLALVFWILAREILKRKGKIKKNSDFKPTLKDFGDEDKPQAEDKVDAEKNKPEKSDIKKLLEKKLLEKTEAKTEKAPKEKPVKKGKPETEKPAVKPEAKAIQKGGKQ